MNETHPGPNGPHLSRTQPVCVVTGRRVMDPTNTGPNWQTDKLVGEAACIALIFDEKSRPASRTWRKWKARKLIPFLKIGKLSFYDPAAVRAALVKGFSITSRRA